MAVLKCPLCGGDLIAHPGMAVAICQYCGSTTTISGERNPPSTHEKSAAGGATATASSLIRRGDIARKGRDFRAAVSCYEKALEIDPENSNVYWNLFLAKYELCNEAELLKEKKTFLWDIDERSLDSVAEYQAALQFASAEEKEHYEAINKELIAARPLFNDKLVPAAAELVVEMGQVSVSMLQRRLKLGYERASMLVDEMEELGIVGPLPSSGLRPVLVDEEGLAQILGQSFNKE